MSDWYADAIEGRMELDSPSKPGSIFCQLCEKYYRGNCPIHGGLRSSCKARPSEPEVGPRTHVALKEINGRPINGLKRCQSCGLSETYWNRFPSCTPEAVAPEPKPEPDEQTPLVCLHTIPLEYHCPKCSKESNGGNRRLVARSNWQKKYEACLQAYNNLLAEPSQSGERVQLYRTNRFYLRCPHCDKEGMNSADAGGNERCFHCAECGFTECEWSSPAHEYLQAAKDNERRGK